MAKKGMQESEMDKNEERSSETSRTMTGGTPGQSRSEGAQSGPRSLMRGRGTSQGGQMGQRFGGQDWLSSWDRPALNMRRLFDNLLEDVLSPFGMMTPGLGRLSTLTPTRALSEMAFPRIDVTEDERNIMVTAELPGMEEKDVDVTLDENRLIIRGEKRDESEDQGRDYYYSERSYGSFERVIPIPESVRSEACQAEFRNGVLEVRLPKAEETSRRRRIEVGQGQSRQSQGQQTGGRQGDFRYETRSGERSEREERQGEGVRQKEKETV